MHHRTLWIVLFLVSSLSTSVCLAGPAQYFVSLKGNDDWSGKLSEPNNAQTDGPFRSLERARSEVRNLRQAKQFSGATISLREGTYYRNRKFLLDKNDSGNKNQPIVYEGWKNEKVILSGAVPVSGFTPVSNKKILERLSGNSRKHVLQLDLKKFDPGTVSKPGKRLELFFGNKPMTLARWPNQGFTKINELTGNKPFKVHGIPGDHEGRFTCDTNRMEKWSKEQDLWLHGYWFWDWSDAYQQVKSIDVQKKEFLLTKPFHHYGYRKGQKFYVLNALSELDSPGEWYLDREENILYFWPPSEIDSQKITLSSVDHLLEINNGSHITFRNLVFEKTRNTLIRVISSHHVQIKKSLLRNSGYAAVSFSGSDSGISGCDIHSIASNGISLSGGDRNKLVPGNLFAINNHIHDFGRVYRTYRPAVSIAGVGNKIQHNLIHNGPHNAIQAGGNDHLIEFNEVYDVCYETGDVGAYYMGRDWTQRGTLIRHNFFHHIKGPGLHGAMAVYLDDAASGISIIGNVFFEAGRAAFIGGGRDNVVKNNIFVNCHPSVHVDNRGMNWMHATVEPGGIMPKRLKNVPYKNLIWKKRYPKLVNILNEHPEEPRGNVITHNISVGGKWKNISKGIENLVTMKNNLIDQDPLFKDAEKMNFQLKDDSPAYKMGFKKIPFDKIGLFKAPDRYNWPILKSRRNQ